MRTGATGRPSSSSRRTSRRTTALAAAGTPHLLAGFTLLEILVVLVIVGVIVSMATLSVGVLGRDRQVEDQTNRLWAVLRQASEEAELESREVALFVSAGDYEFLRFDQRRGEWTPIVDDKLYAPRSLPAGLRFRLRLDSREIVLKPTLPNRADKGDNKKWPPQIMVLSNGDIMPFELRIERDDTEALWRVVAATDSDLRTERQDKPGQWTVVRQTRPPPEDNQAKRVANART